MNLLAQADLDSLPASFVKWMVITVAGTAIIIAFVTGAIVQLLQYFQDKRNATKQAHRDRETKTRDITPQPLVTERAPKRFNAALAESQHIEVTRRLDDHDAELDRIWFSLREEDEKTRKELRDYVAETNLSLGRIEGKLGTLPKEKQS